MGKAVCALNPLLCCAMEVCKWIKKVVQWLFLSRTTGFMSGQNRLINS